jgi:hypothetical protein
MRGCSTIGNPGLFGAGIYIPALYVPLLLVSHMLIFMILLRTRSAEVVKTRSGLDVGMDSLNVYPRLQLKFASGLTGPTWMQGRRM